ncbi:hypothetical protein C1646_777034 [Rhizophagus diaphanus]|nr:hypothetical protein C1646_777034 [Rhizophagus diaphanus] [Rhizophagus sp. MUCL 43196]
MRKCVYEKNAKFDSTYRVQKNTLVPQIFKKKALDFPPITADWAIKEMLINTIQRKRYYLNKKNLNDECNNHNELDKRNERDENNERDEHDEFSDNAANVCNARKIIHKKHPKIKNVRCVTHSINLIACDIVKEKFGKHLLNQKGISGGRLKLYCKTRWTTASESVNSVINLESALEEMASDHDKVLTNDKIKLIIQSRNFFSNLRVLGFVLDPLRKAVLLLESKRAILADCFLSLARLAATLKKLSKSLNPAF